MMDHQEELDSESFSMQEVMELAVLHEKQMHALEETYVCIASGLAIPTRQTPPNNKDSCKNKNKNKNPFPPFRKCGGSMFSGEC